MPTRPDASGSGGFTLVEALVALVILAACLIGFYQFLATALDGAAAAERAATAYDHRQSALALAAAVNPMETPEGSFDLGAYRIRWRSQRLGTVRQSNAFPVGKGEFAIALYRIVFDFPGENGLPEIEVTKLGYHRSAPRGQTSGEGVN